MKKRFKLTILLCLIILTFSCNDRSIAPEQLNDDFMSENGLNEYEVTLSNTLALVGAEYRNNGRKLYEVEFFHENLLSAISKQPYSNESVELLETSAAWFQREDDQISNSRLEEDSMVLDLSSLQISLEAEYLLEDVLLKSSELSLDEYNIFLEQRLSEFDFSKGGEDIELVVMWALSAKAFGEFYQDNPDLLQGGEGQRLASCGGTVASWTIGGMVVGAAAGCVAGTFLAGPAGCIGGGKLVWVGLGAVLAGGAGAVTGYTFGCSYGTQTEPYVGSFNPYPLQAVKTPNLVIRKN